MQLVGPNLDKVDRFLQRFTSWTILFTFYWFAVNIDIGNNFQTVTFGFGCTTLRHWHCHLCLLDSMSGQDLCNIVMDIVNCVCRSPCLFFKTTNHCREVSYTHITESFMQPLNKLKKVLKTFSDIEEFSFAVNRVRFSFNKQTLLDWECDG